MYLGQNSTDTVGPIDPYAIIAGAVNPPAGAQGGFQLDSNYPYWSNYPYDIGYQTGVTVYGQAPASQTAPPWGAIALLLAIFLLLSGGSKK